MNKEMMESLEAIFYLLFFASNFFLVLLAGIVDFRFGIICGIADIILLFFIFFINLYEINMSLRKIIKMNGG